MTGTFPCCFIRVPRKPAAKMRTSQRQFYLLFRSLLSYRFLNRQQLPAQISGCDHTMFCKFLSHCIGDTTLWRIDLLIYHCFTGNHIRYDSCTCQGRSHAPFSKSREHIPVFCPLLKSSDIRNPIQRHTVLCRPVGYFFAFRPPFFRFFLQQMILPSLCIPTCPMFSSSKQQILSFISK